MSDALKRDDRGATALVIAGSMVLIMGILAVAIDVGFGQAERRIDQTGADAAALAGSLELVISDEPDGLVAALDRVYEIVDTNLGRTVDYALWAGCSDANALFYTTLSDLGASNGSNCVSLSEDFNSFRVRIPDQVLDTYFAPVIGSNSVSVNAAAEAERNAEFGGGGNVPFFVQNGTPVGELLCIKADTNTQPEESCGDPDSGNFGDFEAYFYGPVGGDLSTICNEGQTPKPLARAIALGIDHELSRFAPFPGGTERLNGGWCPEIPGPLLPNTIQPGSGYSAADVTNGLVKGESWPGSQSFPGRLRRDDSAVTAQDLGSASIFGFDIDNRPLWDYIDISLADATTTPGCLYFADPMHQGHVPTAPASDVETTYNERRAALLNCLSEADANDVRILSVDRELDGVFDILETPRLGAAPQIWKSGPPDNNNEHMPIMGLRPVFIDSLFAGIVNPHFHCNGLDDATFPGLCVHRPGLDGSMTVTSPGQRVFQSAGAMVLSCEIMPAGTCPSLQDPSGGGLTFLYDLQLTR